MAIRTKNILESRLITLLENTPLTKITVKSLTENSGVSRVTFYYHFSSAYDLSLFVIEQNAKRLYQNCLGSAKIYLFNLFNFIYDNKIVFCNAYAFLSRKDAKTFLTNFFSDGVDLSVTQAVIGKKYNSNDIDFLKNISL